MEKRDDTTTMENNYNGLKRGPWSSKEDEILAAYVKKHGEGNWNAVQNKSGLARCGKSCRLRWLNHLKPDLKKGSLSIPEQQKIIQLHAIFGTKWSKIALELPGRTDNEIKNFWNTRKRKLERAGLPLYPAHIKPKKMNDNRESVSGNFSSQQSDVSQEDDSLGAGSTGSISNPPTSSALIDDSLGGNSVISPWDIDLPPFPPCIEIDDSDAPILSYYNETFRLPPIPNSPSLPPPSLGGNSVISPPDMVSGLPPFPPCIEIDDSAAPILLYHDLYHIPPMIPYSPSPPPPPPPPAEETQNQLLPEPPVSPRSSGLLESIFYPPKVVSEDEKGKQQQQPNNSLEKGGGDGSGSNQRDLTNLDALVDLGWLDNDWDKDRYDDVKDTLYAVVLEGYRKSKK